MSDNIKFTTFAARKSVDANGWTVFDWGAWKEYVKVGSNVSVDALNAVGASTTNYPVGVTMADLQNGVAILSSSLVSHDTRTDERRVSGSVKLTPAAISHGVLNAAPSGQWFSGKGHFRIIK